MNSVGAVGDASRRVRANAPGADAAMNAAPAFARWLDDFFSVYWRHHPVNATFAGLHAFDDRLPDASERGRAALLDDAADLLRRLATLPDEPLDEPQHMDRDLARGVLEILRWEAASPHFASGNPSLWTGEAIFGVIGLLLQQRLDAAAERLAGVPRLLHDAQATLHDTPREWCLRARRECAAAQVLLERGLARLSNDDVLLRAAADARAAFARYEGFVADELLSRATNDYACGPEVFELLLHEAHCVEFGADELERRALALLSDNAAALLRDNAAAQPRTSAPEPRDRASYLGRFGELWQQAVNLAGQHDLLTMPAWPVRYVEQPEWVRVAAPALYFLPYRSPPPLQPPATVDYYVPQVQVDDSTIKLNHVVHHGSLGHHVQNWHAARARSRIGQVAAVDCASRIAMLCGGSMAEGWACYATDVAAEAGFLAQPELEALRLNHRRMAARALADVRLHHGGLPLAEVERIYIEKIGMSAAAAHAEVVKNSLFPAAACMYFIGWDELRRLREALRPRPLRAFHDAVLGFGSVPVTLISRAVRERGISHHGVTASS